MAQLKNLSHIQYFQCRVYILPCKGGIWVNLRSFSFWRCFSPLTPLVMLSSIISFFAQPRAAANIYCSVGGRFFGELRHLLLHSILVEPRWILLERAFIWIHYWHVSCAIYYGHNMGRFPRHLELRHLFSVARMAKRHAPHTEKLLKFTYVLRRLNIYSPLLRGNRWHRCVR